MKTLRFVGVALLTVLMSVGFSACGGDDDDVDNGGGSSSASIEGTWHPKSQIWYDWDSEKNAPNYSDSYTNNNDETWIFTKDGDNFKWRYIYPDNGREYEESRELIRNKENDYRVVYNGRSYSRIVFKNVTAKSIELEYWDGYYRTEGTAEYGIVNLTK